MNLTKAWSPMKSVLSSTGEMPTPLFPLSRDGKLKPRRVRERNKPAYEINREACDDYKLCERYAMVYGYNAAYNRYFRQRRGAK
ncbi:Matrix Gla [Sigmodon hispidus]